jgi:N-acetylmuramoyl-L-alanine amidase
LARSILLIFMTISMGASAAAQAVAPAAVAGAVTLTPRQGGATLSLDLTAEIAYDIAVMRQPDRIVIDLPKVVFGPAPARGPARIAPVAAFRYGLFFADRSRLVIDLSEPGLVEKVDSVEEGGRRRLVFHIQRVDRKRFEAVAAEQQRERQASLPAAPAAPPARVEGSLPVVVIDPGHGGIDPGASAVDGESEKAVVLALGLALRDRLDRSGKVRPVMTRTTDVFVSLSDRVRIAREHGAALMLSLHADTLAYEPGVRGASVYMLSEKASDVISARLADSENRSDQIAGVETREEENPVGDILFDLTKRETRHFSHALARQVADSLQQSTPMHKNALRSAGFRVLTAPDVPSVLVEVGYLSSAEDAKLMQSADWRAGMTAAMAQAVEKFIGENATRGGNSPPRP